MIKWIMIALIGLVILGAMGYNVKDAIEAPATKSNLQYAKEVTVLIWNKYLSKPVKFIWNEFVIKYIWEPGIKKLDTKLRAEEFRTMKLNTVQNK